MRRGFAAAAVAVGLAALLPPVPAGASPSTQVFSDLQCNDCHAIPGVPAAARTDSCVGCHAWVKSVSGNPAAREKAMMIFPKWARYEQNVKTYFTVPDLAVSAARLDPAWVRKYLADPYDTRPAMSETMVRLGADPATIEGIVSWFASRAIPAAATPKPSAANVPAGEKLFTERGCTACHTFGGRFLGPGIAAAPDLQHARERMTDDVIAAWIRQPSTFGSVQMPDLGLTAAEALQLRDFIVLADPQTHASPVSVATSAPPRSPVAAPRWDDVESRVFGKICVHCHMDPAQNEGRVGPGNGGGFGWPGTGIELQTYGSVRTNKDRILAAMHRREDEASRDYVQPGELPAVLVRPKLPGMPLGLPPIPADDIAMVELWYANGAPQ